MSRNRLNSYIAVSAEQRLLRSIQVCSLVLVLLLAGGCWWMYTSTLAFSVLLGGGLINGSFLLLKTDITQMLNRVDAAGGAHQSVKRVEKIRFIVKFYARLIVVGLLLAVLASHVELNMIGVALGLATVMLSVFIVVLGRGKSFYEQRLHGA